MVQESVFAPQKYIFWKSEPKAISCQKFHFLQDVKWLFVHFFQVKLVITGNYLQTSLPISHFKKDMSSENGTYCVGLVSINKVNNSLVENGEKMGKYGTVYMYSRRIYKKKCLKKLVFFDTLAPLF